MSKPSQNNNKTKHEAQLSSIPALKTSEGTWVLDAQEEANLLADTFAGKSKLPRLCRNSYTECALSLELQAAVAGPTEQQCVAVLAGLGEEHHQSRPRPCTHPQTLRGAAGQADAVPAAARDRDSFLA